MKRIAAVYRVSKQEQTKGVRYLEAQQNLYRLAAKHDFDQWEIYLEFLFR
jgi:DNA invertase Pin-like site-specific DNA recombinase